MEKEKRYYWIKLKTRLQGPSNLVGGAFFIGRTLIGWDFGHISPLPCHLRPQPFGGAARASV